MASGTKLFCPNCQDIQVCSSVPLAEALEKGSQRLYFTEHADIQWFRRARECQRCYRVFLTGEIEERLIDELALLRSKSVELTEENKALRKQLDDNPQNATVSHALITQGEQLRARVPWLYNEDEGIPESIIRDLVRNSVWWLLHPSGKPVRAPNHAENVYHDGEQWVIDFGANSFLAEKAIRESARKIRRQLSNILKGDPYNRDLLDSQIKRGISRCVANHRGDVYQGYYPSQGNDLVFGVTSICIFRRT
jgi:hypothetical protein